MKAYIAGKITGDPTYKEKFACEKARLEREGYTVLDPSELPEGMAPADYMRICISMIETADVAFFLPNWKDSRGAKLEYEWCLYTGKQVVLRGDFA